ncbi:MAG: hypothetical protein ACI9GZ_003153, partial [Bacteroidia bacterium]
HFDTAAICENHSFNPTNYYTSTDVYLAKKGCKLSIMLNNNIL